MEAVVEVTVESSLCDFERSSTVVSVVDDESSMVVSVVEDDSPPLTVGRSFSLSARAGRAAPRAMTSTAMRKRLRFMVCS